jgi:O-antigen/teichoic acid export membrane protein
MTLQRDRTFPVENLTAGVRIGNGVRSLLRLAEVDLAVFFAVMTRAWQFLMGPITVLLIARYFSPELQGFYYTFASLLALQAFVELGFCIVILNTASHEWAHLRLDSDGHIRGESDALSRLVSLGRLVFKWYAAASGVFIVGVGVIGYAFFSKNSQAGVQWQLPWFVLVAATGLLLWTLPFNSLLEGCNQVATVNRFRLIQAILGNLALWSVMVIGGGLWAAVAMAAMKVLVDLYLLLVQYWRFFKPFLSRPSGLRLRWRTEILPMQWRLAVSGMACYLGSWLYSPVMFHYHGAVVAGQIGVTQALANVLSLFALPWVLTKVPHFGVLIAKKQYAALDARFLRLFVISLVLVSAGAGTLWIAVYLLNVLRYSLAGRLLPPLPSGLFFFTSILTHVSQCQAAYLRAHRREPLVVMSVSSNLLIGLLVWLLGSRFGPLGAAAAFLAVEATFVIPYATIVFFRCRAAWHKQ